MLSQCTIDRIKAVDAVSAKKLNGLVPAFVDKVAVVMEKMAKLGWKPRIAEALRTQAQQKQKVAAGNSTTLKSKHLLGEAVDIIDTRYAWNIPLTHKFWYQLGTTALAEGLVWGGIWLKPERMPIYKKAVDTNKPGLITWFCDVAHVQWRP